LPKSRGFAIVKRRGGGMAEANRRKGGGGLNAILFFGFGIAAGILMAFSGLGYLQNAAALVATVFLSALMVILLLGVILYAARRRIWTRLFGFAEVQIDELADPLGTVAERALAGDAAGATRAARDLVAVVLARYAWITTRRWIIASLTGLIAAMAALAGTALLFQQNQLIAVQSGLLTEQNVRIAEQTDLIAQQNALAAQQVQLAEASRNAALAVEVTTIAAALGGVLDQIAADYQAATGTPLTGLFNAITTEDLTRDLVLRITSVSRAMKPYRFLDLGLRAQSQKDRTRIALQARRAELPNTYARLAAYYGWTDPDPTTPLIDRPASPERGQLLTVLLGAGLRNIEGLNSAGLDLTFAQMTNANILLMTAQGGLLDEADFTGSYIVQADLGGASLENARFRACVIRETSFAAVTADRLRPPYPASMAPMSTRANGADFAGAVLTDTTFKGAQLLAARFDGALGVRTGFAEADLGLATFRGTILLAPDWRGANLKSADFDGAILFGADPLADLAAQAAAGSFRAERFRADPVSRDDLMAIPLVSQSLTREEVDQITGGAAAVRLIRVQPFDDGAPP